MLSYKKSLIPHVSIGCLQEENSVLDVNDVHNLLQTAGQPEFVENQLLDQLELRA